MVELVERMLDLRKQLPKANTPHVWADSFRPTASGPGNAADRRMRQAVSRRPRADRQSQDSVTAL
jgi:hypothetical protein